MAQVLLNAIIVTLILLIIKKIKELTQHSRIELNYKNKTYVKEKSSKKFELQLNENKSLVQVPPAKKEINSTQPQISRTDNLPKTQKLYTLKSEQDKKLNQSSQKVNKKLLKEELRNNMRREKKKQDFKEVVSLSETEVFEVAPDDFKLTGKSIAVIGGFEPFLKKLIEDELEGKLIHWHGKEPRKKIRNFKNIDIMLLYIEDAKHSSVKAAVQGAKANNIPFYVVGRGKNEIKNILWNKRKEWTSN